MVWTYRVVQLPDQRWECRFGRTVFDEHDLLDDAVDHMSDIAAAAAPSSLVAHAWERAPEVLAEFPHAETSIDPLA